MTAERAITIGQLADECQVIMSIGNRRISELADIDLGLCRMEGALENEASRGKLELMMKELDRANAWHREPVIWAAIGMVATVAAIFVARETVIRE